MTELMQASQEWASRPDDERFLSLPDMLAVTSKSKARSISRNLKVDQLKIAPVKGSKKGLQLIGPSGNPADFTNWSFSQLAAKAGARPGFLARLTPETAADCLNQTLQDTSEVGLYFETPENKNGVLKLRGLTSPGYQRVHNADVVEALMTRFGDGLNGQFVIPGEFGKEVPITKATTTLYASDRDMFVFLADEKNRIELPNRREGKSGSLARGFFVRNSEVGYATLEVTYFLFDYMCCNHIIWGATDVKSIKLRHTENINERWLEQVAPALNAYAQSATVKSVEQLKLAQAKVIDSDKNKVLEFLAGKFGTMKLANAIDKAHVADEGRPVSTIWDAVTGATAYARSINYMDDRVMIERTAGKLLDLVAN